MTNAELKQQIAYMVADDDVLDKIIILEGDEFADGFVGLSLDNQAVYSYEKLVESLTNANSDWTHEQAVEWIEYNTIRALPYMASEGNAPIIIHELTE